MVKGSIKFKVEYVGGGAATFGKRELLKMMPVHLMQQLAESQVQQLAEPQMQQPAESAVKVRSICEHAQSVSGMWIGGSGRRAYLPVHPWEAVR